VYLHDLAARLRDGRLDLERLLTLDDDHARTELTHVKGVGRFTADGVLMLALRRQDVWPAADLALRRAVERVWELDAPASIAQVDALGERFRPWRTWRPPTSTGPAGPDRWLRRPGRGQDPEEVGSVP
jgi:DNA-3-methyladenine glycosylase II